MNIPEINNHMRQRPPFQMIDRVLEIVPCEFGKGLKNVSINEPFFEGHFPEIPIMPGVLITESAAQLCSIVMSYKNLPDDLIPMLLKIDSMKFINPVIPGDGIIIEVKKIQDMNNFFKFETNIFKESERIACGKLIFSFVEKDKVL